MQPRDRARTPQHRRRLDDAHDTAPRRGRPHRRPSQDAGDGPPAPGPPLRAGHPPFEIRDRLIELDDLRRRGIVSEEEFAAKKSECSNRIRGATRTVRPCVLLLATPMHPHGHSGRIANPGQREVVAC